MASPLDFNMQDMCKHAAYIYKNQSIYHLPKVVFIFIAPSLPWKEGRFLTDKCYKAAALSTSKLVATGRATGLVILQEQARWLRLTNLTTKEKEELLVKEFLVDKINVSGAVVRRTDKEMEMRCEEKREMLALKLWHRFRIPKVDKVQGLSRIHGLGSSLWVDVTIATRGKPMQSFPCCFTSTSSCTLY